MIFSFVFELMFFIKSLLVACDEISSSDWIFDVESWKLVGF
jgi:hypothetical protein